MMVLVAGCLAFTGCQGEKEKDKKLEDLERVQAEREQKKEEADLAVQVLRGQIEAEKGQASQQRMELAGLKQQKQFMERTVEWESVKHFGHRRLGVLDRFWKSTYHKSTLTYDIHVHHTESLDLLDMCLYPRAISVISLFREYRIIGLYDTSNNRQHVIRTPEIVFRGNIRLLVCHKSILITVEFIKIFCGAADKTGLLHLTDRPSVETAILIYLPHNVILSRHLCIEKRKRNQGQRKHYSSHKIIVLLVKNV